MPCISVPGPTLPIHIPMQELWGPKSLGASGEPVCSVVERCPPRAGVADGTASTSGAGGQLPGWEPLEATFPPPLTASEAREWGRSRHLLLGRLVRLARGACTARRPQAEPQGGGEAAVPSADGAWALWRPLRPRQQEAAGDAGACQGPGGEGEQWWGEHVGPGTARYVCEPRMQRGDCVTGLPDAMGVGGV